MDLFEQPLLLVDVETDGMNAQRGHIIEIAAIRIENGVINGQLSTLLNPGIEVPYFISNLTGIRTADLVGQPTFDDIAEQLQDLAEGALFVAHNVRFDFSFIRQEFRRVGLHFAPKQLCTVKLSRYFYPEQRSHKLSSLIARHEFDYNARHRAYDDAYVLYQFLHHLRRSFGAEALHTAAKQQLHLPALPQHLDQSEVAALPNAPGVYIFHDDGPIPLYIGKSVNIRRRVLSHFTRDTEEHKEFKLAQRVTRITHHPTEGELSALLLESHLIKTLHPLHNRLLRRQRNLVVVKGTSDVDGYTHLSYHELSEIEPHDFPSILAMYTNRSKAKASMITAIRTYDLCPKLCGIEKGRGSCFSYQLQRCRGACMSKEPQSVYNERLMTALAGRAIEPWPYTNAVYVSETKSRQSGFIVDNWRITGIFSTNDEGIIEESTYQPTFDLDAYKILRAFLSDNAKRLYIAPVTPSSAA